MLTSPLPRPYLAPQITVTAGQTLFSLDEEAEVAYLVREGILLVSQFSLNGREVITSVYFPGEVCGGFDVLTDSRYGGTARAPTRFPALVDPIRRADLMDRVRGEPSFYRKLITTQREKERFKDQMLLRVVTDTCEQRIASSLLWLGRKTSESSRPLQHFQFCRKDLADLVGTTIETVIRVLSSFRKRGLFRETNGHIALDVLALTALSGYSPMLAAP